MCGSLRYTNYMKTRTEKTSIRFTPYIKHLIELLCERLGVSQTDVIEMAIREYAKKRNVK